MKCQSAIGVVLILTASIAVNVKAAVHFVQVTDPHLFGDEPENERALRAFVDEVNTRVNRGTKFDFIVVTGDLGVEDLLTSKDKTDNKRRSPKPQPAGELTVAGAKRFSDLIKPSRVRTWLFVPGNNDLIAEDPQTIEHFTGFIDAVAGEMGQDRVVDLSRKNWTQPPFTFVGFNNACFKSNNDENDRKNWKRKQLALIEEVKPRLAADYNFIFYHIPEVDDPYLALDPSAKPNNFNGDYKFSAWVVDPDVRTAWDALVTGKEKKVRGLFAGHFHDSNRQVYRDWKWLKTSYAPATLEKLRVCPPISIKKQEKRHATARGFREVGIADDGSISSRIVWYASGFTNDDEPTPTPTKSRERAKLIKLERLEAARGDEIMVIGERFPANAMIRVKLNDDEIPAACLRPPEGPWDEKSFSFLIPEGTRLGRYRVSVAFVQVGDDPDRPLWQVLPAVTRKDLLLVTPPPKEPLKVDAIEPLTGYPDDDGSFHLAILGHGFSLHGDDNIIEIENQGQLPIKWVDELPPKGAEEKTIYGHVVNDRQIDISLIPRGKYHAPLKVLVRVGEEASVPVPTVLALVGRWKPVWFAGLAIAVLAALVLLMLRGQRRGTNPESDYTLLERLVLDPETDTYSLSKVQFLAWTLAAVFGYAYFTLVRMFVQGSLEFPDIPVTLPGLILVSASTTVFAQGIQAVRGPKGAGEKRPRVVDLITSGGVMAPERFQFLVWTVLGILVFLGLLILTEPGNLKSLPNVPQGLLVLMGVSSAGYLGGKITRPAGPVIDEIIARRGSLNLEIRGRNLSADSTISIGPVNQPAKLEKIEFDKIVDSDKSGTHSPPVVPEVPKRATLKILEGDEQSRGAGKKLLLVIADPKAAWLTEKQDLMIENPDGQKAMWSFAVTQPLPPPNTLHTEPPSPEAPHDSEPSHT